MSLFLVKEYLNQVEKTIHYGGSRNESSIRNAFFILLNHYAKQKDLMLIPELSIKAPSGKTVIPDGTLKDSLRQDWGYWESKDESDNINDEISKKFAKGYPKDNIIFEDSNTAVLFQNGNEVSRISMKEPEALDRILTQFINFERAEVTNFRKAIELFKQDVPKVTESLRLMMLDQESNSKFINARENFLEICQKSINPEIIIDDVNEMMLQHILTADIFNRIFDEPYFHRENNIAKELERVLDTFFVGSIRKQALSGIQHYFEAINAAAAGIADHHEKQKFLKIVYETFYKSYNPKAADRLGVVYTPNEIVKCMIEGTDYLLYKHFGKGLEDKGVEILDPATGTGTYICEIIDYISKDKLPYKYENEIHANEVAILPYYIANLNIEYTYKQKVGKYKEFGNLCFVDTLDNLGFDFKARGYEGTQDTMFGFSAENVDRIVRQNERKISVVIGNPPYNANQQNENDNNKNRAYYSNYSKKTGGVDGRIKETFIKYSTAQKTKVYDMYSRFFRWAMDRLNNQGIVAFITNRSFIDSRTFDGFRKCVQDDFDYVYIIDTKSDVRANPKIAGTTHNVFGIQTGVAIMFLVKKSELRDKNCEIRYISLDDNWRKEEKLQWFNQHKLADIPFEHIQPDKNNNWINLSEDNDWEEMIPIFGKMPDRIIEEYSVGVVTARDEWVYDHDKQNLSQKIEYFANYYNKAIQENNTDYGIDIKWSRDLKRKLINQRVLSYNKKNIVKAFYKPFSIKYFYAEQIICDVFTEKHKRIFGDNFQITNKCFGIIGKDTTIPFTTLAFNKINDLNSLSNAAGGNKTFPLNRYDSNGNQHDNITDWALEQFQSNYSDKTVTKEDIFHYVYGVLHNPEYRQKYELNLKREFPRIPFYNDFWKWSAWGKELMDLHINFEEVEQYPLIRTDIDSLEKPKCKLKADKTAGTVTLDENTVLSGVPAIAWDYKLGNRSALEWILDQYKEKKPKDPTIAEKFNTYRFADYKDNVIDLLMRVCSVSVKTMEIVGEMREIGINNG